MTTQLARYDAARTALQIASSVDEVKDIRDKAEAMAAYARQAQDTDLIKWATEIKVRAERKAGQMLTEMPKATGTKAQLAGRSSGGHIVVPPENVAKTLSEIGVTKNESSRWQKLAAVPDEQFEQAVTAAKEVAGEVTTAAMLRAAKAIESPATPAEENPKTPKPKLLSEEESARILADNAELRERMQEIASGAQEAIADNESMAKIFDADDRLAATLEEIKRLKAEVDSLKWQLNGAINKGNDAIRRLKSAMAKIEKLEKQAKAAGIAA